MQTLTSFNKIKIKGFFWILNNAKGMCDKESKNNMKEEILNNCWYIILLKKNKLNSAEKTNINNDKKMLEQKFKKKAVEKIDFWIFTFFSCAKYFKNEESRP